MAQYTAGADPDELDRLAARFHNSAEQIRAVERTVNLHVSSSPWKGLNADRFRTQWAGEHRRAINEAFRFLQDGSRELRANAQEQRRVSSGAGGHVGRFIPIGLRPWPIILELFTNPAKWASSGVFIGTIAIWGRNPIIAKNISRLRDIPGAAGRFDAGQERAAASMARRMGVRSPKLLKLSRGFGKRLPVIGKVISGFESANYLAKAFKAASSGDIGGAAWNTVVAGYKAAGFIPVVGLFQTAFELGYGVGEFAYTKSGAADWVSSAFISTSIQSRFGTSELTPSQAEAMNKRYSGTSGALNIATDGLSRAFIGVPAGV